MVKRAHWPTKENKQNFDIFVLFRSMEQMAWDGPKWGREDLFPANPDLVDILGRTDSDFEILFFWIVESKCSGFRGPQISKIPDFQTPAAPAPDELSDPNLTPLPTHPGIKLKYVARSPCCDKGDVVECFRCCGGYYRQR